MQRRIYRSIENQSSVIPPAARAVIDANRRGYKAFCAGRRKAQQAFANAPGRRHVAYTITVHDYIPLLPPGIDPRAYVQAHMATAVVVWAKRNRDGSITRCVLPLIYQHAGQLLGDLTSSEATMRAEFRKLHALAKRGGSIVADHIAADWVSP